MADDLGYGDLGCYGQKKFTTPNIDRVAAEGMRFTQVYAGSTVCAPSRCSLMTGLHTGHALVRGNKEGGGVPLRPQDLTVTEMLKKANYVTGGFGKWGLGLEGTTGHPNRKGFDEWFGYLNQTEAHFYYPNHLFRNSEQINLTGQQYSHDLIVEAALDFIRQNKATPFFLYFAPTIPHASLEVPQDSLKKYLGRFPETPFKGPGYSKQEAPHAAFAGMIDRLDQSVGRILNLLKELELENETLVFITSDNGPHQEGGGDPGFFASAGPLRGIKRDLYEGGIRVPMIVRWPGKIRPGRVSSHVWALWDFLPTAAEIAGVKVPASVDGISVLPVLLNKSGQQHQYLYWEFFEKGFQQAIRYGKWKGLKLETGKPLELYNLDADLGEAHNIAAEHPEIIQQLERLLKSARSDSELWPLPAEARIDLRGP